MKKILFLQPSYAHYREDLFAILSDRLAIHFLFDKSKSIYPGNEKPKNLRCDFIDKKFKSHLIGLAYYLYKYDFDIIVSSVSNSRRTIISFLYSAIFRKKFILWILEWQKPAYRGSATKKMIKRFRQLISRKIINRSNALIVGGTAARNYALNVGFNAKNIFTAFQCSKDINRQGTYFQKNLHIKAKYTFLFLSRIIPWKGLDILIRAFHLLKQERNDIALLIAGDGPSKKYCFNLAESLKILDVEFIGSIIPSRTNEIFKKADVFVLPSRELDGYHEDWGLVVNEAMSMKLPVIATTAVGAAFDMIVDGHNGFIVKENSVGELYQAMSNILKCDLIQMGNNSRKIFEEKNNYIKMAKGFLDAIDHVAKQSGT
jgi:glycosyltransferase involved in cell wall biosynthesis